MSNVIDITGRLVIVRNAEDKDRHRKQVLEERRRSARRPRRAAQRAARLRRTASWANPDKIAEFYYMAERMTARSGIPHEVDHIIPLLGETVSGLHVETNLRVIPRWMNRSKSNDFDESLVGDAGFEPATFRV